MDYSDEQLMLLEQLSYLDDPMLKAMGLDDFPLESMDKDQTLGEYLSLFDKECFESIKNDSEYDEYPTADEWEDIINTIKSDPTLCDLKLAESDPTNRNYCFVNESNAGEAIVIFRGTWGGREWNDNVEALNQTDTACQTESAAFINSLPYDDITVVGHSKGGNDAQYVTILCDKVTRCVSMDGQGFSEKFLEKYAPEIAQRGGLIKNYSMDTDYVHILLYSVPGSEQIYIKGDPSSDWGIQAHAPATMFDFSTEEDGSYLKAKADAEHPAMTYLRELTYFVMELGNEEDLEAIVESAGPLLALVFSDGGFTIDGKRYESGIMGIVSLIADHPDEFSVLLDYVASYIRITGLTQEQVEEILAVFGFDFPEAVDKWLYDLLTNGLQDFGIGYRVFDFSDSTKALLTSTIDSINALTGDVVSSWTSYSGEEWYDGLLISTFISGISSYFSKIGTINEDSKTQIETIFTAARDEETACAASLDETTAAIDELSAQIAALASTLG